MKRFLGILLIGVMVLTSFNGCARAEFEVSSITVTDKQVVAGEPATVEAITKNVGGDDGVFSASLMVDGQIVDTKDITIAAGATEKVYLTYCPEVAGEYAIQVGGLTTNVIVLEPAEFQLSPLVIIPAEIAAGEPATVKVDVTNIGGSEGVYTATLKVNGVDAETKEIVLDSGVTQTTSFTLNKDIVTTYNLEIDGQTGTLRVLNPAEFKLDSLSVTPPIVIAGSPAIAKVDVTNVGEATGVYEATLEVNDVKVETKVVTLSGGETETVSFNVVRDVAGMNVIKIDGLTSSLQVAMLESYSNPMFGYSISHAAIRQLDTSDKSYVHFIYRKGFPTLVIEAEVLEEALTLDEYFVTDVRKRHSKWPSLEILSSEMVRKAETLPGIEADCTFIEDGTKYRAKALYIVSGRLAFCASVNAPADRWDFFTALVDAMLQSFVPPKPDFSEAMPVTPVGFKGYFNWEEDFFIAYPEGWEQQERGIGELVGFAGPMEEGTQANFCVTKETFPQLTTAKEVITQTGALLEEMIHDFRVVSTEEITINNVRAARGTFTWSIYGVRIKQELVALLVDKTCFMVTFTSTRADYDRYADIFNTIANSFQFLSTKVPATAPAPKLATAPAMFT